MPAKISRVAVLTVMLTALAGPRLFADPSDCPDWARGEQTGDLYELEMQGTRTVTTSFTVDAGAGCGLGAEATRTTTDTFNVGTYRNQSNGQRVQVNCSTGQVVGRL